MNPSADIVTRAELLADAGRAQEAVALLRRHARDEDADAVFALGRWQLAGNFLPRDIAAASASIAEAARLGHRDAERVHIAFLAHGAGGERAWGDALDRLAALAAQDEDARRQHRLIAAMALSNQGDPLSPPVGEPLDTALDIRLFRAMLTSAECRYLIETAAPLMRPSLVVDSRSGRRMPHPVRTSDAASFSFMLEDPVIHALNRRMAAASGTRPEAGEPLQILRYAVGQQYRPHFDALEDRVNQRLWTMLVWLNEDFGGGETEFPLLEFRIRGRIGDALLFRNAVDDGTPEPLSRHAGLPVSEGAKFIASRWIRAHPLDLSRSGSA